jgi:predicted DNA-binding transcriptional regulator AlpA
LSIRCRTTTKFETIFEVGMIGPVLAFMTRHKVPLKNTIVDQLRLRTSYVRASEVMSILGVTRNTLCDWINAGTLPAFRLGKNNVCDPTELAAFLEARRTGMLNRALPRFLPMPLFDKPEQKALPETTA